MIALRRTVKYSLIAVYIVFCPLLICHALGIMIKPKEKTIIQATGLISVKTTPGNASVFLNGILQPEKTPMLIPNLPENDYEIRVERPGYRPWDKTVRVRKNFATAHERIVLIPATVRPVPVRGIATGSRIVATTPSAPVLILGETLGGLTRLAVRDNEETGVVKGQSIPLITPHSLLSSLPVHAITPIPGSELIIAETEKNGANIFLLLNAQETVAEATDITALCAGKPRLFFTDPRQSSATVLHNGSVCRVFPLTDTTTVFLSEQGRLFGDNSAMPFVDSGIRGIIEDRERHALVYWTAEEIGIIATAKRKNDETHETVKRVRLVTGGRDITAVTEANRGSHLVYTDGDRVMFTEADIRGPRTVELMTSQGPTAYIDRHGRLFVTRDDGTIETVTVVPERTMFNLALPVFDEEDRYE